MVCDIELIRKAAADWMDGNASEAQTSMLSDYFQSHGDGDIPQDLRTLACMLRGMGELRLERMPDNIPVRRNIMPRLLVAAASAAACMVAVLVISRPVYGYDYDGSRITCEAEVMECAAYLDYLSFLNDDINLINDIME